MADNTAAPAVPSAPAAPTTPAAPGAAQPAPNHAAPAAVPPGATAGTAEVLQFLPKAPHTLNDMGQVQDTVEELVLKFLYLNGETLGAFLCKELHLTPPVLGEMMKKLEKEQLITVTGGGKSGVTLGSQDFKYGLFTKGREKTVNIMERNKYTGIAPVTMDEYQGVTKAYMAALKTNEAFRVTPEKVHAVFSKRIGYQELNHVMGQAAANKQSIFLYGGAGNGKTDISFQLRFLLPPMIVPYCVEVSRQIIRVFDSSIHVPDRNFAGLKGYDPRWVVIEAPMVAVGGEMMLSDLDVKYDEKFKAYKAPPQVLANGGVLLVDDLGRQQCRPEEILNRLIVPLENHIDFMVLGGTRLEVITDEVFIFSSNLSLKDICDPAFLRRIPYKVVMRDPKEDEYRAIYKLMCQRLELTDGNGVLDYLIGKYASEKRPFKASQPRDILRLIRNKFYYFGTMKKPIENVDVDDAYAIYFPKDIVY